MYTFSFSFVNFDFFFHFIVKMNNRDFATVFVRAMIKGGHMSGWFGDKSESFVQEEVNAWTEIFDGRRPVDITQVTSNAANLHHYDGWSWSQAEEYIKRSGYSLFQFRSHSGPAWALAKEKPSPQVLDQVQELLQHPNWRGIWKKAIQRGKDRALSNP